MCQSEECVNKIITVNKKVMHIVIYCSIEMYRSVSTYHCYRSVLYMYQVNTLHNFYWIWRYFTPIPPLSVSPLQVSVTTGANPTVRQSYTFTCTVTPQGELTGTPTVQWRGPGGDPITTGGDFTVSSTPPYTLTINPLLQSHDGQYTCQATIGTTTGSSSATLTVEGDW